MSVLDLIPQYASPGAVINAYRVFGLARLSSGINKNRHYRENLAFWNSPERQEAMGMDGRYIEHQDRLEVLRYGGGRGYPISYGGCEMIAVYNLLSYLNGGELPAGFDFPEIIMAFETRGVALEGAFGSTPRSMMKILNSTGLDLSIKIAGKNLNPDELYEKPFIFTAFNDRKRIDGQIHSMAATPAPDGSIILHNSFESDQGFSVYKDPVDVLMNYHRGHGRAICVIS